MPMVLEEVAKRLRRAQLWDSEVRLMRQDAVCGRTLEWVEAYHVSGWVKSTKWYGHSLCESPLKAAKVDNAAPVSAMPAETP